MDYVAETQFAAENLFTLIFHEQDELLRLRANLQRIHSQPSHLHDVCDFLALNPDLDDEGIGTVAHWEAYFDVEPAHGRAQSEVAEIEARINARGFARAALCGSLLQIAKQGISTVHGGLNGPIGRLVGTQPMRDIIWQARNQAMHFEEPRPLSQRVQQCFETLAADLQRSEFREYRQRNLAFEVIDALGWSSYSHYEQDIRSCFELGRDMPSGSE
jgi:hypothetical protein